MSSVKRLIPENILKLLRPYYHGFLAWAASVYFGHPGERMVVIGITGTAGKSTTTHMLAHILNNTGRRAGYITTVDFFDGTEAHMNKHGLSMPGGILLQRQLLAMVKNNCKFAIVECTSEGLAQNRHFGINFDMALFTNLSRAHLDSHGSFGNYHQAKSRLFSDLTKYGRKGFFPKKMIGVNFDDPMSGAYISFPADRKFGVTFTGIKIFDANKTFIGKHAVSDALRFTLDGVPFELGLLGEFNVKNAALAAAAASELGVGLAEAGKALKAFRGVRGRMEEVETGKDFKVIVDYGCEPASFRAAAESAAQLPHNRLVHVFGSTGGHRDREKRFDFGRISCQFADYIIVTNDDIYDSDPQEIARNIEQGIKDFKLRRPPYEIILDRRSAISHALAIAQPNDVILITGKGSEQFLVLPGNKRIEWDECQVVREELVKLTSNK